MDLGLVEYALFVTLGLWATLFVDNPLARAAGLLLMILATLRALTEKDGPAARPDRRHRAGSVPRSEGEPPQDAEVPAPEEAGRENGNGTGSIQTRASRPRRRVL